MSLFCLFVLAAVSVAQQSASASAGTKYEAGQVWQYKTAPGAESSTLLILKVEQTGKKATLVHIRIDNIPLPSCGGFHLTTSIDHIAIPEKILRESTTQLVKQNAGLPGEYFVAYREWQKNHHRYVTNVPRSKIPLPQTGPMICNWRETT